MAPGAPTGPPKCSALTFLAIHVFFFPISRSVLCIAFYVWQRSPNFAPSVSGDDTAAVRMASYGKITSGPRCEVGLEGPGLSPALKFPSLIPGAFTTSQSDRQCVADRLTEQMNVLQRQRPLWRIIEVTSKPAGEVSVILSGHMVVRQVLGTLFGGPPSR